MGDAQFASQGMMYTFDALRFYEGFLRSIRDEQLKGCSRSPVLSHKEPCTAQAPTRKGLALNGSVPDATPFSNQDGPKFPGSAVWQSAYVTISRQLWRHYGRLALPVLRKHYTGLQEFVRFLRASADNRTGLVLTGGMGEWAPPNSQSVNKNRTTPAARPAANLSRLALCGAHSFKTPHTNPRSLYRCGKSN